MRAMGWITQLAYCAFRKTQPSSQRDLDDTLTPHGCVESQLSRDDSRHRNQLLSSDDDTWDRNVLAMVSPQKSRFSMPKNYERGSG